MTIASTASSLHSKLAAIRAAFGPIQKTGEMKEGPRFKYVEAREIASKFVELASAERLTMLPIRTTLLNLRPTASGKQTVMTLGIDWQITDADSGEAIVVSSVGEGADQSDKGAPKAQTNAMKYALLLILQAAGDDAEADGKSHAMEHEDVQQRPVQRPPRPTVVAEREEDPGAAKPNQGLIKKLMATFDEVGMKDGELRKAYTFSKTGKGSSKDLTIADVEKLLVAMAAEKDELLALSLGSNS